MTLMEMNGELGLEHTVQSGEKSMFVSPMLAHKKPEGFTIKPGEFAAQEKYDGHRLIAEISDGGAPSLFVNKGVTAWSRYGLQRVLPTHLLEAFAELPNCLVDGELNVPGKRSYGVTELGNGPDLEYVIFDAVRIEDEDYTVLDYDVRRQCLEGYFGHLKGPITLAPSWPVNSMEEVKKLRNEVWAKDGEGLILRRRTGLYMIGKRSKDWIKIKKVQYMPMKVVSWIESKGLKNYRGKYATVLVRGEDGIHTTVKTKNDATIAIVEKEATFNQPPFFGRTLWIEYNERTPDQQYREPRWYRWDDELTFEERRIVTREPTEWI